MKNNVVIEITYYVSDLRIVGLFFNRGHFGKDGEEFLSRKYIFYRRFFMEYVYYMVPEELKGEYLIPLNELRRVYPNLYGEYIQKYKRSSSKGTLINT